MTLFGGTVLGALTLLEVYHFYDGPKLFSCESVSGQRFLVFWLGDDEGDRWLYVPVSETRLSLVRAGEISLRTACQEVEGGWVYVAVDGEADGGDTVLPISAEAIAEEDLPEPEARIALETATLPVLTESRTQRSARSRGEVLDLGIATPGHRTSSLDAEVLGRTLIETQSTLTALVLAEEGYQARTGPVPREIVEDAKMRAVATFPSSFGIRLESGAFADLLGDSRLKAALESFFRLLEAGEDQERLEAIAAEVGARAIARFTGLLTVISSNHLDLQVGWASPSEEHDWEERLTWKDAARRLRRLMHTVEGTREHIQFSARLEGIDVHRRTFDLLNLEENSRVTGRLSEQFRDRAEQFAARVPYDYLAVLELRQEVNPVTGEVKDRYFLMELVGQEDPPAPEDAP